MDMQRMLRQAQKMQADIQRVQEEAGARTAEASAGGGAVVATANGKGQLVALRISAEAADPADTEMLADLVMTACNEALSQAQEMVAAEMAKVTPKLPGGLPRGLF